MGIALIIPNLDFSGHGLGKVTLNQSIPLVSMSIAGETTVLGKSATYKALLYPGNTSQRAVTWSVLSGGAYASINTSSGVLTIDSSADGDTVVIKATSVDNSDIYATLELTVTYAGDAYGEDLTPGLTWTPGYIDIDYNIQSSDSVRYSSPVSVDADDILLCRSAGTAIRIVTECGVDYSNKKYGLVTRGFDYLSTTDVYNYAYHVAESGYVVFCSKDLTGVEFWRAQKIEDITPTWQSGYIDTSGSVQTSSVTSHSDPIAVEAGDIIVLSTAGYGMCLIALTNQGGSSYTPILVSPDPNASTGTGAKTFFGALRNSSLVQANTPSLGTTNNNYQGSTSLASTVRTYAMYIESDGYISVCSKTSLGYQLSKYKAG